MANANKPFGLRPVGSLNAASYQGNVRKYYVPATDTTAFYVGDAVKLAGTEGSLYAGDAPLPTVTKAASTNAVVGVCVGVEPVPTDLTLTYRKASTGMNVYVDTDANTIYEIQGDSDTYDAADIGLNMNFTVSTGSTTTGISNAVADQSSAATTATLDLQVLASSKTVGNDLTGGYPLLLVKLNNYQYVDGATGV